MLHVKNDILTGTDQTLCDVLKPDPSFVSNYADHYLLAASLATPSMHFPVQKKIFIHQHPHIEIPTVTVSVPTLHPKGHMPRERNTALRGDEHHLSLTFRK